MNNLKLQSENNEKLESLKETEKKGDKDFIKTINKMAKINSVKKYKEQFKSFLSLIIGPIGIGIFYREKELSSIHEEIQKATEKLRMDIGKPDDVITENAKSIMNSLRKAIINIKELKTDDALSDLNKIEEILIPKAEEK